MFRIKVPAKDKNAAQRYQKKAEAESKPDVAPEYRQIKHRRKHGGNEREQSSQRADCHFGHHGAILHTKIITGVG